MLAWLPTVADEVAAAAARAADRTVDQRVARTRAQTVIGEATEALARLTVSHARRLVPDDAYVAARDELVAERDSAQRVLDGLARQETVRASAAQVAQDLLDMWGRLPADRVSAMLRELVVVWVSRRPSGRGGVCEARGVWQDE